MLTNSRHLDFVDANKMQINQVLQIKKSPTPRQWNGGTVHTIGACTTTNTIIACSSVFYHERSYFYG